MDIILASASPRRRELLGYIYKDYQVRPANINEEVPNGTAPQAAGEILAGKKTLHVQKSYPQDLIIGADTVVVLGDEVLGKPKDEADAVRMLEMLSGNVHKVYTGVSLRYNDREYSFTQCTDVWFYSLTKKEINDYISTGEPFDKAGGYGIQGKGCLLVEKIDGDYFNVMGLPVARLKRELEKFGV
ncbi:MAG: Maf family protein [Hydrogenoanaerobacterium sp.]